MTSRNVNNGVSFLAGSTPACEMNVYKTCLSLSFYDDDEWDQGPRKDAFSRLRLNRLSVNL